jgi:hypothetical protein
MRFLVIGIVWIIFGTIFIIKNQEGSNLLYVFHFFGILYLVIYWLGKKHQYLTINDNILTKKGLLSQTINLNDVVSITELLGSYKLATPQGQLQINIRIIDPRSLKELNAVLDRLKVTRLKPYSEMGR